MEAERIEIYLIPAPDDAALNSREYQAELETFDKILRSRGVVPQRVLERLEAAAGSGEPAIWLGQFILVVKAVTPIVTSAIVTAIGGYFHAKRGRQIEIGKNGRIRRITGYDLDAVKVLLDENRKTTRQVGKRKAGDKVAKRS